MKLTLFQVSWREVSQSQVQHKALRWPDQQRETIMCAVMLAALAIEEVMGKARRRHEGDWTLMNDLGDGILFHM